MIVTSSLNPSKQLRKGNLQGSCKAHQHLDCDVFLTPLKCSHITSVKVALVGKVFLGKASFSAQFPNFLS